MKKITALCAPLVFAIACNGTPAQTAYTVKRITFKNPGTFTQRQLETAAQVHAGDHLNAAALGAAAQRLVDTGYFDNVQANFDGTATSTAAVFTLTPSDLAPMLHTGFENFVWLTHDQLEAAIHAKLSLFNDRLVEGAAQVDAVDVALTEALAAAGITATVTHETVEPTLVHPERTLEYRVQRPSIRVMDIKLAGVTPELRPLVQKSVNGAARTAYNDGLSGRRTADLILAPLLDAGYTAATLSNLVLEPAPAPDGSIALTVAASLQSGDVYHVAKLAFTPTPLVTAEAFAAGQKLHPGDIAAMHSLLESLAPVDAAYRRQGYLDVIVDAHPAPDQAAHTVDYNITVTPGMPYRIHEVKTEGLDAAAKADFDRGFLLRPGEIYNPEYVAGFLKNNSALKALTGYAAAYKASADPSTHTVDLLMNFFKGSVRQEITVH